jgi:hypothetical protein
MDLRIYSDFFSVRVQHQLISFSNQSSVCSLRGTKLIFECNSTYLLNVQRDSLCYVYSTGGRQTTSIQWVNYINSRRLNTEGKEHFPVPPSTINFTWSDQGSVPHLRGEMPATNRSSHITAHWVV